MWCTLDRTYDESCRKVIYYHDSLSYRLSWFTKLLYCMDSQPREDIESVPKSIGGFDIWVRPSSGHIIPMD